MLKTTDLFDPTHTLAEKYLACMEYPWAILPDLRSLILLLGMQCKSGYEQRADGIWIHKTACIAPSAHIAAPCIIGPHTEVRHCAFIRGSALIGAECTIGNSTEIKNSILFDGAQTPHFNYAGDSILGYRAHMGAGSLTSNVKCDKSPVVIQSGKEAHPTGLKKLGALIGDFAEIGCGAVLNPGSVIGRNSTVYPLCSVRGCIPEKSIFKSAEAITPKYPQKQEAP